MKPNLNAVFWNRGMLFITAASCRPSLQNAWADQFSDFQLLVLLTEGQCPRSLRGLYLLALVTTNIPQKWIHFHYRNIFYYNSPGDKASKLLKQWGYTND